VGKFGPARSWWADWRRERGIVSNVTVMKIEAIASPFTVYVTSVESCCG
jgi:hypothetical protein